MVNNITKFKLGEDPNLVPPKFKQGDVVYLIRHKNLRGVVLCVYDFDYNRGQYRYHVGLFSFPVTRLYLESSLSVDK